MLITSRAAVNHVARQSRRAGATAASYKISFTMASQSSSQHVFGMQRSNIRPLSRGITTTDYSVIPKDDFGEYSEYSVIFTNRSLNLMSNPFQRIMRDLNGLMKETYNADKIAIMPGSGTFGMEAAARQFATNKHVMVLRNGWFSFRWTEIFDHGGPNSIPKSHTVLKAQPQPNENGHGPVQYAPHPIDKVVEKIYEEKPEAFFAPHVETSTGMILPDDYMKKIAAAVHDVGGIFVLDCIASGTVWADMKDLGVDVVISAPQKGWTGPACCAMVMMSDLAASKMDETQESSFSLSLKKWSTLMDSYVNGGWAYHTTMPTDGIRDFHEVTVETMKFGMDNLKASQLALGKAAHEMLHSKGLSSVAAPGYQSPGVLVYHSPCGSENPVMLNKFKEQGLQIAMGVPWRIDEPEVMKTFRVGLFGLDKMNDIDGTVATLETAVDKVLHDVGFEVPAQTEAA